MYILSDSEGNLIQTSNAKIENLQEIINRFSNELNIEVIGTDDVLLYLKTKETGYFDIVVRNNKIIDIAPKAQPITEYAANEPIVEVENYFIDLDFRLSLIELGV